jgi:hypothetical protein
VFLECAHASTRFLRGRAVQADVKEPGRWQRKVSAIVAPQLPEFYSIADAAAARVLTLDDVSGMSSRSSSYLLALRSALLCICDCERYVDAFDRARSAAELVLCLFPGDADAHQKLGLLAWKCTSSLSGSNLLAMHHFCFGLASSPPPELADDTLVVSRFVAHVRDEMRLARPASSRGRSVKFQFSCAFIEIVWSVLVAKDLAVVKAQLSSEDGVWDKLSQCLSKEAADMDSLEDADLRHIVGVAMYVRHRVSPLGNDMMRLDPHRAQLADLLIARLILVLGEQVKSDMRALGSLMRARKKNRVRRNQKKRKASASAKTSPHSCAPKQSDPAGLELFAYAHEKVAHARTFSSTSFLAHFWSKSVVISQESPLDLLKRVADTVDCVGETIDQFSEQSGLTGLFGHVTSYVMVAAPSDPSGIGSLPALDEDVLFSAFSPCYSREMFRRVTLTQVHPKHLLFGPSVDCVTRASEAQMTRTHLSHARKAAGKHLDAFSHRMMKRAFSGGMDVSESVGNSTARVLVEIGLRRQRLGRIRRKIAEYAGGRILRFEPHSLSGGERDVSQLLSPAPDPAQRSASKRAREDGAATLNEQLPPHKRRRIAAAMSQCVAPCGKPGLPDDGLLTPCAVAARRSPQPLVTRTPAPLRFSPERSYAPETPLILGQLPSNNSQPCDLNTPVLNADELEQNGRLSIGNAVTQILYKDSVKRELDVRRWFSAVDPAAIQGNPFMQDRLGRPQASEGSSWQWHSRLLLQ